MKLIFSDPTPRWVPFIAAAMIVAGVWVAGVWNGIDFLLITKLAVGLACVLFVLIFFQSRFFWKGQVASLSGDGERFEAVTAVWIGRGKRIAFNRMEAKDWTASASTAQPPGEKPKLGTVKFTVRGTPLDLSFVNPKRIDVAGLTALSPGYWARVRADYPTLKNIGG